MRAQNIGILLWYTFLFQILTTISKSQFTVHAKTHRKFKHHNDHPQKNTAEMERYLFPALKFKVYVGADTRESNSMMNISLPIDERDVWSIKTKMDLKKPLAFLIHGYQSNGQAVWLQQLSAAYLYRKDANVFIVDWGSAAEHINYFAVYETYPAVANVLISFIDILIKYTELEASNIHIIGHGLGAHIAGYVGHFVPGINRITGLDPAGALFPEDTPRLSKIDAEYVDVIHTSNGLGNSNLLGHVDLYVNGGSDQPGCDLINLRDILKSKMCSHSRAPIYFIESLNNPQCGFVASDRTERAYRMRSRNFDPNQDTVLGLETFNYSNRGKLYVMTNGSPPFCRM